MLWQYLLHLLMILALSIIQVGFFNQLIYPFNHFSFLIPLIFFVMIIFPGIRGYYWAIMGGILLEVYSYYFPGVLLLSLLASTACLHFVVKNVLVNRSYVTSILSLSGGIIIYNLLIHSLSYLLFLFNVIEHPVFLPDKWAYLCQISFSVFLGIILYFLWGIWEKKIGRYFIYS